MAHTILIKRGLAAGILALAEGEPGFTTDNHSLWVGSAAGNVNQRNNLPASAVATPADAAERDIWFYVTTTAELWPGMPWMPVGISGTPELRALIAGTTYKVSLDADGRYAMKFGVFGIAAALTVAGRLTTLFESETGGTAAATFGAYWMLANAGDLYVLLGNEPAGSNGCLLVKIDLAGTVTAIHTLDEQGGGDGHIHNGVLYIAGIDPTDDWTLGNFYTYNLTTEAWAKIRTLPLTMHTWGLCHDSSGYLFAATGSHTGDSVTWTGRVMRSTDGGATWDQNVEVSDYRVYDVIEFGGALWGVTYSRAGAQGLARSADGGLTWAPVVGVTPYRHCRLVEFNSQLLVLAATMTDVYEIASDQSVVTHALGFTVAVNRLNILADGGNEYAYCIGTTALWRTADLVTWESIYTFSDPLCVAAWAEALITCSKGTAAALYWRPLRFTPDELRAFDHVAISLTADADEVLSLSTQEIGLDPQAANQVLAGPTTGGNAAPTFRALVAGDIPGLPAEDIPDLSQYYVPLAALLQVLDTCSPFTVTDPDGWSLLDPVGALIHAYPDEMLVDDTGEAVISEEYQYLLGE